MFLLSYSRDYSHKFCIVHVAFLNFILGYGSQLAFKTDVFVLSRGYQELRSNTRFQQFSVKQSPGH